MPGSLHAHRLVAFSLPVASLLCATIAVAANDCTIAVTFTGIKPAASGIEVSFRVENKTCASSVGRFTYTYETDDKPGRIIERSAPQWRGVDSTSFTLTDFISIGKLTMRNVGVVLATVESTKN